MSHRNLAIWQLHQTFYQQPTINLPTQIMIPSCLVAMDTNPDYDTIFSCCNAC